MCAWSLQWPRNASAACAARKIIAAVPSDTITPRRDHRGVIVSPLYKLLHWLLSVPAVLLPRHIQRRRAARAVPRECRPAPPAYGPCPYEPANCLWFAALSLLVPLRRWRWCDVSAVTGAANIGAAVSASRSRAGRPRAGRNAVVASSSAPTEGGHSRVERREVANVKHATTKRDAEMAGTPDWSFQPCRCGRRVRRIDQDRQLGNAPHRHSALRIGLPGQHPRLLGHRLPDPVEAGHCLPGKYRTTSGTPIPRPSNLVPQRITRRPHRTSTRYTASSDSPTNPATPSAATGARGGSGAVRQSVHRVQVIADVGELGA
jgi:hypothetical protein